jgi:hypothetical protein
LTRDPRKPGTFSFIVVELAQQKNKTNKCKKRIGLNIGHLVGLSFVDGLK